MTTTHTSASLVHRDTETGREFRAECVCGWTSPWRTTNACMGNWHRHRSAQHRRSLA